MLRQELKHAAASRSVASLKAPAEAQVTDAEKILIRALASATEMQSSEEHVSARDGAEEEFDPARQAQYVLQNERLHLGLATEALIEALLGAPQEMADVMNLELPGSDRNLLASMLMRDEEPLTAERLEGAVRALRRMHLRRRLEQIQIELQSSRSRDPERMQTLMQEKVRIKRALMDPSLADEGPKKQSA